MPSGGWWSPIEVVQRENKLECLLFGFLKPNVRQWPLEPPLAVALRIVGW